MEKDVYAIGTNQKGIQVIDNEAGQKRGNILQNKTICGMINVGYSKVLVGSDDNKGSFEYLLVDTLVKTFKQVAKSDYKIFSI